MHGRGGREVTSENGKVERKLKGEGREQKRKGEGFEGVVRRSRG